jgi:nitronate monooxygenase
MLKTKLTELCGIEHPVVCGGMHYVGYAELASAVSNAGALGMITALTQPTPEALRAEIQKCKRMTSKPFGVNLTILPMLIPADYDAYINVVASEGVKVCEITGGNPEKYVNMLHDAGIVVIHKSATLKHALKAQSLGVDIIEVSGYESATAGRQSKDDTTTWVVLAKALEKLNTPVIVSGASATGRQLAAALAMGAQGITMGTRFMCTEEAPVHPAVKKQIASPEADEYMTCMILKGFENGTRVYKSPAAEKVLELEAENADFDKIYPYVKGENWQKCARETGDWENSTWSVGMSIGLIEDVPKCKDLVARIVTEAEGLLQAGARMSKL